MTRSQPSNPAPSEATRGVVARKSHPDHHLWRNGRLFWVAFTVHLPGWRKERVRLSLGTADLREARRRRDELLRAYPQVRRCALSLRPGRRRRRT